MSLTLKLLIQNNRFGDIHGHNTICSRISHGHSKSFPRVRKSTKQTEVLNFITEVNPHARQLIHNSLKNIQVIRNRRRIIIPQRHQLTYQEHLVSCLPCVQLLELRPQCLCIHNITNVIKDIVIHPLSDVSAHLTM
ncbi:hypothetical protein Dimus_038882 [Dionaea muscipula]